MDVQATIKQNEEGSKLKKAIEFAKQNPSDPRAKELRRRIEQGLLNPELSAMGKPTYEVKPPVPLKPIDVQGTIDAAPTVDNAQSTVEGQTPMEKLQAGSQEFDADLRETGTALAGTAKDTIAGVKDIATDGDYNLAQKSMGILGKLAGGVSGAVGDAVVGAGKALLSQEAEDRIKSIAEGVAKGVAETDTAKALVDWYGNLDKENKLIVDSLGGMAALITDVFGAGVAKTAAKPVIKGIETAAKTVDDVGKTVAKTAGQVMDAGAEAKVAARAQKLDDTVGRIIQGTPEEREAATRALREVDLDGIETYGDAVKRMDETITEYRNRVDTELDKDKTLYSAFKLARKNDVKGIDGKVKSVYDNPVINALEDLDKYYRATGDVANSTKVKQYGMKLKEQGLTVRDVNEIARMHGNDLNAFNANGELSTGLTKQAAENTRSGLKDVVRTRDVSGTTEALDKSMSDMIATKKVLQNMETAVAKAEQKRRQLGVGNKVMGLVFDAADWATLGSVRGLLGKINLKAGAKNYDALELQKRLKKELATFEKLDQAKDAKSYEEILTKYLEETQPGLSIRPSVTPEKVGKEMSELDFYKAIDGIEDITTARLDPEFNAMLKKHGLDKAKDDELVRFLKEATDYNTGE